MTVYPSKKAEAPPFLLQKIKKIFQKPLTGEEKYGIIVLDERYNNTIIQRCQAVAVGRIAIAARKQRLGLYAVRSKMKKGGCMGWKFKTGIPIYRQIVDLVEERILGGTYPAGGELPTVRDLAMELAVNPNTVQRAFSELDKKGVTESKRTAGRFVTADSDRLEQLRRQKAKSILRDVYGALKRLGIGKTEIESILQEVEHDSIL